MNDRPVITYTLAVHNATGHLEHNVRMLARRLQEIGPAEILLIENGSRDGSRALCDRLATALTTERLTIRVDSVATGLGHAHRRGLALARGRHVVVIGVDLPFRFSDLEQWLRMSPTPLLVLGSKSHAHSRVAVDASRRIASRCFRVARAVLLGIRSGDTQGSIIVDGDLGRRIAPLLRCTDYLVTTEIVAWAVRFGARPVEIPVEYPDVGSSTVSPLRDGLRMLGGMVSLRRRLRRSGAPAAPASSERQSPIAA